jgi:hypothetical protein
MIAGRYSYDAVRRAEIQRLEQRLKSLRFMEWKMAANERNLLRSREQCEEMRRESLRINADCYTSASGSHVACSYSNEIALADY